MGLEQKIALILFLFKIDINKEPDPVDSLARNWSRAEWLINSGFIGHSQFPLKLTNK